MIIMRLCDLIGSILYFKKDSIVIKDLEIIKKHLNKENIKLINNYTIPDICYELKEYDYFFDINIYRISVSKKYADNINLLKKIFFNKLKKEEKNIIYNIINELI